MSGELRAYLPRRRAELMAQIEALRHEVADIDVAMEALGGEWDAPTRADYAHAMMTMKGLAVEALGTVFPNGATTKQLLAHFHRYCGRLDITRESLSPQLSRLKTDGVVRLTDKRWSLAARTDREGSVGTPVGTLERGRDAATGETANGSSS